MKRNRQILVIVFLISIVIALLSMMGNPAEIWHIVFIMAIVFLTIFLKNNLAHKQQLPNHQKWPEPYNMPLIIRWDRPYLYIGAKWGYGFDYLMAPQNMNLQNRIDQIILWTQNTSDIRTILWKDKIDSFEDFQELLQYIFSTSIPTDIIGNKIKYSMNFGSRRLNIIVQDNWIILTITF